MDYDIAIIGAGPAGLSFACSLRDSGLNIVIIEKLSRKELADPPVDGRDIALTHLSRKLMQQHGSWQQVGDDNISPIQRAEVIDGDSPYTLSFNTPDDGTDALGFLISNHLIRKAIFAKFETLQNVTLMDEQEVTLMDEQEVTAVNTNDDCGNILLASGETLTASLGIAADTRFSSTRRQMGISTDSHDFGRTAIVGWMEHELSHEHTAFECFHYGRTLAILPMPGNISSAVITVPSNQANEVLSMGDEAFNADIEQRLHGRLGKMKQVGQRYSYPLVGVHANRFVTNRFALIGDAAVGMHPVTAHGFNLGLSGQDLLATEILGAQAKGEDIWNPALLQRYQQHHMLATRPLYHGTNAIVGLFTNDSFPVTLLRSAALRLSNNLPPVKWAIQQKLMAKNHLKNFLPPFFGK
ncbi:MAG: 5-demethoxyubiquinol-8 5-hydroxylase UbiM [Gammaproteobacteria bacterium]|nr:5-demethoxyubiquinol-8 5-hydroxylase UbiM [Gammaproteobacteria bacterium]